MFVGNAGCGRVINSSYSTHVSYRGCSWWSFCSYCYSCHWTARNVGSRGERHSLLVVKKNLLRLCKMADIWYWLKLAGFVCSRTFKTHLWFNFEQSCSKYGVNLQVTAVKKLRNSNLVVYAMQPITFNKLSDPSETLTTWWLKKGSLLWSNAVGKWNSQT